MEHAPHDLVVPGIALQPRDLAVLLGFFESRIMTLAHVAAIYFEGRTEAAKKRLQKLKSAGFLAERPRRAYHPSILFLTRKSFEVLAEGGYLDHYPPLIWSNLEKRARVSDLTLRHELDVMDVKAAFYNATKNSNISIKEFITWPLLCSFQAAPGEGRQPMTVKPDGFARIHVTTPTGVMEHVVYLEVDRSTEVLDTLITRAVCYRDWFRRGGLAVRAGRPAKEFEQFPFRVLVVVRTEERRNNLCERLLALKPPILSQVWLTTKMEAVSDPFDAIWARPVDLRECHQGPANASSARRQRLILGDA